MTGIPMAVTTEEPVVTTEEPVVTTEEPVVTTEEVDINSVEALLDREYMAYSGRGVGSEGLMHTFIYSALGESCHHACMRLGEKKGEPYYCDDSSLLGLLGRHALSPDVNDQWEQIMGSLCLDGVGNPYFSSGTKTIGKSNAKWAPFIRAEFKEAPEGKCWYAHLRGGHKCYFSLATNHRLCGCIPFNERVVVENTWSYDGSSEPTFTGIDYVRNPSLIETKENGEGWHTVSDMNCDRFCAGAADDIEGGL